MQKPQIPVVIADDGGIDEIRAQESGETELIDAFVFRARLQPVGLKREPDGPRNQTFVDSEEGTIVRFSRTAVEELFLELAGGRLKWTDQGEIDGVFEFRDIASYKTAVPVSDKRARELQLDD